MTFNLKLLVLNPLALNTYHKIILPKFVLDDHSGAPLR